MKKVLIVFAFLPLLLNVSAQNFPELEIGGTAPLLHSPMQGIDGKSVTLSDISESNGLLIVFSCNTCPWVLMWEDRYVEVAKWAENNKVGFVLVNSNYKKFDGDDSMDNMKKHATEKGYAQLNYVMDADSKLANAIGAKTTPHVFLFDGDMKLAYKGAIDDNAKDKSQVSDAFLQDALMALGSGKEVAVNTTVSKGCSIKRKLE